MKNGFLLTIVLIIIAVLFSVIFLAIAKSDFMQETTTDATSELLVSVNKLDNSVVLTMQINETGDSDIICDSMKDYDNGQSQICSDDISYLGMRYVDDITYDFLKEIFSKINYCGEFKKGDANTYDFYLNQFYDLVHNELAFIDPVTDTEIYLNQFDAIKGYMEENKTSTHHLMNKGFLFFDIDEDGAPELCIASEYIFKYIPELGQCVLWGGFRGNFYYSIVGSRKMTWNHGSASYIYHAFYQFDKDGEVEFSTLFFLHNAYNQKTDQQEIVYIIELPIFSDMEKHKVFMDEIGKKAYLSCQSDALRCRFRVTEEQYNELTSGYFTAIELANQQIDEVTFSYYDLFGSA